MNRLPLTIASALLLATLDGNASSADDPPAWERIGPEGASICALAVAPNKPNVVYAGSAEFGGVFRSRDRGLSWSFAGSGLGRRPPCALAVDARDPNRLWAAAAGQLFTTSNGGRRWRPLAAPTDITYVVSLVASPTTPRTLLLGSNTGIWRSSDGGATWRATAGLPFDNAFQVPLIDPLRPSHVFAGTSGGVFRSRDGGRTWRATNDGLPRPHYVRSLALDARDGKTLFAAIHPDGLYRSLDAGESWRPIPSPEPSYRISTLSVVGRTLYLGTSGGLYRSNDNGRTFPAESLRLRGQRVAVVVGGPFGLLAGAERGLYRSSTGVDWSSSQLGLRARHLAGLQIDPRAPRRWYMIDAHEGVLRSLDGGATWRRAGTEIVDPLYGPLATALAVDPVDSRLYAGLVTETGGSMGISDDAARSWRLRGAFGCMAPDLLLPDAHHGRVHTSGFFLVSGCSRDPHTCFQFRSLDGGETFNCASDSLPPGAGYLTIDPATHDLYTTSQAGLHRSHDGGDTWTLVNEATRPLQLVATLADPSILYALVVADHHLAVVRSGDRGATWTRPAAVGATAALLHADPLDPLRLYALRTDGAYQSRDGGESWTKLGRGDGEVTLTSLALDVGAPQVLYATTTGGLLRLPLER